MNNLPSKISSNALRTVANSVIPEFANADERSLLVLSIRIDNERLVARDLAAFLELLDHVYGRSIPGSFNSYARRSYGHFEFSKCQPGSWELIAEQALGIAGQTSPLIILWLVLKYLPSTVLSLSSSYNQIEQGRLARANRRKIREEIERSDELSQLPAAQRAEVARLVNAVAEQEVDLMPRVKRFMQYSFLDVKAYIKDRL